MQAKKRMWSINRLVQRDGGQCYLCHEDFESKSDITIDHLISKSKGGGDLIDNLRLAHRECNLAKKDLSIEDFAILQEGF